MRSSLHDHENIFIIDNIKFDMRLHTHMPSTHTGLKVLDTATCSKSGI